MSSQIDIPDDLESLANPHPNVSENHTEKYQTVVDAFADGQAVRLKRDHEAKDAYLYHDIGGQSQSDHRNPDESPDSSGGKEYFYYATFVEGRWRRFRYDALTPAIQIQIMMNDGVEPMDVEETELWRHGEVAFENR